MKTIIDCNLIISAGMGSMKCQEVICGIETKYQNVISKEILVEYKDVISRAKFSWYGSDMIYLVEMICEFSELIDISKTALDIKLPDAKDEIYLRTAISADVDFLITGNLKDFSERQYGKTKVISVADFLTLA